LLLEGKIQAHMAKISGGYNKMLAFEENPDYPDNCTTEEGFRQGLLYLGFKFSFLESENETINVTSLKAAVIRFANSPGFSAVFNSLILINTLFLAIEHDGISDTLDQVLTLGNIVLSFLFTIEIAIKLWAYGPSQLWGIDLQLYADRVKIAFATVWRFVRCDHTLRVRADVDQNRFEAQWMDIFDTVIVVSSDVELVLYFIASSSGDDSESSVNVSVLRTFRLFRIFRLFRLARSWHDLRSLISATLKTLANLGDFTFLMMLLIVVYALVGMSLFGNIFTGHEDFSRPPRAHFDTFFHALLSVFQVHILYWNTLDGLI
jgi:hypothetical protein